MIINFTIACEKWCSFYAAVFWFSPNHLIILKYVKFFVAAVTKILRITILNIKADVNKKEGTLIESIINKKQLSTALL